MLQELIAPSTWVSLGSKSDVAYYVKKATSVLAELLRLGLGIPVNCNLTPPFRFPPENMQSFANSLGALHAPHPAVNVSVQHTRRPWRRPETSAFSRPENL